MPFPVNQQRNTREPPRNTKSACSLHLVWSGALIITVLWLVLCCIVLCSVLLLFLGSFFAYGGAQRVCITFLHAEIFMRVGIKRVEGGHCFLMLISYFSALHQIINLDFA